MTRKHPLMDEAKMGTTKVSVVTFSQEGTYCCIHPLIPTPKPI